MRNQVHNQHHNWVLGAKGWVIASRSDWGAEPRNWVRCKGSYGANPIQNLL